MDQPVGISFLGGFLINFLAGIVVAFFAKVFRKSSLGRMFLDIGVGTVGGVLMIFVLPMKGYAIGNIIGWPTAVLIGTAGPILVLHLISKV